MRSQKTRISNQQLEQISTAYEYARSKLSSYLDSSIEHAKSKYWEEESQSISYLQNATPEILERLREHCHWITGLTAYQYAKHHQKTQSHENLANRLYELIDNYPDIPVVPERREYAGFGFEIDGNLYNVDTLKYHEVIVGLHKSGIIKDVGNQPIFIEIGSGFGGLADVLLRHFTKSRIVLIDLPEVLLLAATFLGAWYPDKKLLVPTKEDMVGNSFEEIDILCIPNVLLPSLSQSCIKANVLINTVSFQEMTSNQVDEYVDFAYQLGIQYVYSLNRDVSNYNKELDSVRDRLLKKYRIKEISVLETEYTSATKKINKLKVSDKLKNSNPYRHVAGTRL
jgi:putative sugar O-methyltransferase